MAKIIFELDDELEQRFRKTIMEVKGLHKGVIKESLEEAVDSWIRDQAKKRNPDQLMPLLPKY